MKDEALPLPPALRPHPVLRRRCVEFVASSIGAAAESAASGDGTKEPTKSEAEDKTEGDASSKAPAKKLPLAALGDDIARGLETALAAVRHHVGVHLLGDSP